MFWLGSLAIPHVVQTDSKTAERIPLLQIESFNYSLVKRPDVTKKQEKYQVKVEIEFSSPNTKACAGISRFAHRSECLCGP